MMTVQRVRWQLGVCAFLITTSVVLWILWALVGRRLSAFEITGVTAAVAIVIAVFAWAFSSGEEEKTTPNLDNESRRRHATSSPSAPSPDQGTQRERELELAVVALSTKPVDTPVPSPLTLAPLELADRDEGHPSMLTESGARAIPAFSNRAIPIAAIFPENENAGINTIETDASRSLAQTIDRNEALRRENKTDRVVEPRWYGYGQSIRVAEYVLRDPMTYISQGPGTRDDASYINLSLTVGRPVREPIGSLGYYPTYAKLSPNQRANYLRWLASGRIDPLDDIGYAFLFFYGLERRLLLEQHDLSPIVKEIVRLLETYTFSGSFDGYLSRFLAFTLARSGIETLKDKWFEAIFAKSRLQRDDDFLAVALAWFFKKGSPLPVAWAIRIARQDPRSPRSVVLDRLPEQFHSLFEKRYRERFADGLILKVSKRDRDLNYRPASPSLLPSADFPTGATKSIRIPHVLGIQSQFAPLVDLWSSCIEELRPLSRLLAKGTEVDTREAFEALPDELKTTVEHPDKEKWDRTVNEHTNEDGCALVEVSKLAAIHGLPQRATLTPKQSQALAQTAEYVGLVIEPDARLTNRPYSWEDVVSLLRPEGRPALPTDSRYVGASLMLELGVYVAAADGTVEDVEIDQVARFLESQFLLDPPDARRLEALKRVFVARPPSLTGLAKRLQATLTLEQREAVGRFLTGIAAANGIIDRKEVTALRSAYRALDVGVDKLNGLLEEFRRAAQEPVEIQRGDQPSDLGELIPPRPQAERDAGITLDEGLLKRLMAETAEVTQMLAAAMRVESAADEEEHEPTVLEASLSHLTRPHDREAPPEPDCITSRPEPGPARRAKLHSTECQFEGLDLRFHAILSQVLTAPVWRKAEFDALARDHKLMPAGALDAVNTWAYELFDDPIIVEQGDDLHIQSHLVEGQP